MKVYEVWKSNENRAHLVNVLELGSPVLGNVRRIVAYVRLRGNNYWRTLIGAICQECLERSRNVIWYTTSCAYRLHKVVPNISRNIGISTSRVLSICRGRSQSLFFLIFWQSATYILLQQHWTVLVVVLFCKKLFAVNIWFENNCIKL